MLIRALTAPLRCQRGVALPMAMISLMILTALIIAFSMMAASEPVLANNQLRVAEARAVAESGIERAIWALNLGASTPGATDSIPNSPFAVTPPYDGNTFLPVTVNGQQVGVFTVSVTQGTLTNERVIVATGYSPSNVAPYTKQMIQVTVIQSLFSGNPPPAALTVRGEISAGGHSLIDSRSDTSCGNKAGTYSEGLTTTSGSAKVYGADGNNTENQSSDVIQYVPDATMANYSYSDADLNALKALAKKNGTYYQGTVTFDSSNNIPNGIVFVDTVSGQNIDHDGTTTDPSDFASVDIHGNAPSSDDGIFHGVLIVAGSLSIAGNFQMHGLIYAVNDFTYTGTGTGQIVGGVVSRNIRDTSTTSIDTNTGGNADIVWNCSYVKTGGGYVPPGFIPEAKTYKEISG